MSIVDIDKTSSNRSTPDLNSNDSAVVRKAHNTYGNTLRRAGGAVKQFMRFAQGIIEARDANNDRSFFLGYDPTISTRPVIRIAKEGYDALDPDADNLAFNSEQNVLKVADSGTATIDAPLGGGTFNEITHNLGYVPVVLAFATGPVGSGPLGTSRQVQVPWIENPFSSTTVVKVQISNVRTDIIQFEVYLGASAATYNGVWTIKYYLLQESAT